MSEEDLKLYHFNGDTKEYIDESIARLDPLEKQPLIPRFATTVPLPSKKCNKNERYIFENGQWKIVPDFRGEKFYTPEGRLVAVQALGEKPDPAWLKTRPKPTKEQIIKAIKAEAQRRIVKSGHDWMAMRKITTGIEIPEEIIQYAAAVRKASDALESTAPEDYANDQYWPEAL